ncbi:bifunctional UDP-N-acetylglucosamine diphosphorylase/glucosamine-1-phosphate N-acetyltransferase GlmU [Aerococcaceae bacterium DSM 111020]|nr:bifunctional UDP-N-acetylglucosamine diphosphorylase/glucosamine-1-phosphate N-acetyltransferase GlmU [Aerococcaceae bacterium DSM 111020]
MTKRMAVILAAGKGTRMKSDLYKVMHPVNGLPMIDHVMRAVEQSDIDDIVTIVGHGAEMVKEALGERSQYALQEEQLGTGHAVQQAAEQLEGVQGNTLVICGDTPLLTSETLSALFKHHEETGAKGTILSSVIDNPTGYGRVIRAEDASVSHIVEEKDASDTERQVQEINTGTYVFDNQALFDMLSKVSNDNAQGEYYLPDVIGLLKEAGELVQAYPMADADEGLGVNDRIALAEATRIMTQRINTWHMRQGVTFYSPETTYIEADVEIGSDTILESGVSLKGQTQIGSHCHIGANSEIVDSTLADHVRVTQSVIEHAKIASHADVGPFAHLRPQADIGEGVHIGNFVEVKNATIGKSTKAGHLAYIGDADVGENVNIGCGAIFVNFDGKHKFRSNIGDDAFIGSNSNIVAPINIGDRAFIAAGSTIVEDVEDEQLAITRSKQSNIEHYWDKLQKRWKEAEK